MTVNSQTYTQCRYSPLGPLDSPPVQWAPKMTYVPNFVAYVRKISKEMLKGYQPVNPVVTSDYLHPGSTTTGGSVALLCARQGIPWRQTV